MKIAELKVELIDHMGTDLTVVNAARVSFDKTSEWDHYDDGLYAQPFLGERDAKLIKYLADHNHWSPFAHTSIQLRVKAPIFVARQLVKHQVGGVWNEVSRRYVDAEPEFYFPDQWRGRPAGSMKQGSSGVVDISSCKGMGPEESVQDALNAYHTMLHIGVAPEQARMILPQNTMTEWYWTGSLMFFARVCKERLAPGAQQETGVIAEQIASICNELFPVSWKALTKE